MFFVARVRAATYNGLDIVVIDENSSDVTVVPVKLMQVPEFKAAQDRDRYAPHVKPSSSASLAVNNPGPKTVNSEYLAMQNADESAARLALTCAQTGIEASDLTAWNCYPWYINRAPKTGEMRAGFGSLKQVVALMPHLEVVIVHGVTAHHAWNLLAKSGKQFVDQFGDRVLHTFHMRLTGPVDNAPLPAREDRSPGHPDQILTNAQC